MTLFRLDASIRARGLGEPRGRRHAAARLAAGSTPATEVVRRDLRADSGAGGRLAAGRVRRHDPGGRSARPPQRAAVALATPLADELLAADRRW